MQCRCLDKASIVSDAKSKIDYFPDPWRLCTVTQVEELKILLCMFPIWASGIIFCCCTFLCEWLAYYGVANNLVTYLTTRLHEGPVSAARNVTIFQGTCYLTPLLGSFLADAYWGRYWTIVVFYGSYLIGICTLTLSAIFSTQSGVFFLGIYLIAVGIGGIKPCICPFGADQFDDTNHKERASKALFFNWNYFTSNIGALIVDEH
ncbi:protein NRT1/ PTR FAMILY 8.3-like [Arachis ipaensis]|uniref:protein NRT1/ PTR FAMILY 8.3-like n=1 Tax=Arachis ipaensis TaxID=130454 RepID=UPI000A2B66F0|nr:protein NRT1/ PTR FAMILY 8.3-like [Arachis ipaensis]